MERDPRPYPSDPDGALRHPDPTSARPWRSGAARRLAILAASLSIVVAAIPASALAWVGPPPSAGPAATTTAPRLDDAKPQAREVIYETISPGAAGLSIPDQGISAAQLERAAAANVAQAAASAVTVAVAPRPTPAKPATRTVTRTTTSTRPAAPTYQGRNYLWFPSLGIHHAVSWYACSASYALSYAAVYRWGCAGANNVYLMAHAGGIFGPLYTAYYAGRLKAGMLVVYADGNARIHYFKLQWWKTTPPSGDVGWAYAAQAVSSLTLQTCVGADSSLRLVVRFVEVAHP